MSLQRLVSALVLVVASVFTSVAVVPASPAAAGSTYLCSGYQGCRQAGYSNAGYQGVNDQMFWRMYAGHNCTNYVAYRLVRSGLPNTRPWSGSGNAENWGRAMASITDDRPMVGAVAWWKANVPGAGSAGHVAYVEQVVSGREIIVSEDSWGGDFHWRRITKDGTGWPSGFIHFNDRAVVNDEPPAVVGMPTVGQPVTADAGAWQPAATYRYQWLAGGAPVAGATTETFTPTPELRGKKLTVRVTARRQGYVASTATSTLAPTVAPGTFETSAAPAVSGAAEVDQVLTAAPASFSPGPESQSVQWLADGQPIPGATGWKLALGQEQIGAAVTARVSAKSAGYRKAVVDSAPTARVIAGTIEVAKPFRVRGVPRIGRTLTAVPGEFTPADADVTHTWLRDGAPVAGATGPTYQLGPDDVGRRMSLRVTLRAPHYRSVADTVALDGPVATTSELAVRTKGRPGRAVVVVQVAAPGVAGPGGPVKVRVGGRVVRAEVVDGRARVVVPRLSAGRKDVKVVYAGTELIRGSRTSTSVVVARLR